MFYVIGRRTWRLWVAVVAGLLVLGFWVRWAVGRQDPASGNLVFAPQYWPEQEVASLAAEEGAGESATAMVPMASTPIGSPSAAAGTAGMAAGRSPGPAGSQAPQASSGPAPSGAWRSLADYRLERARLQSRQLEVLGAILADETASEERKVQTQQRMLGLMQLAEREAQLEGMLKAAGVPEAVAIIGENGIQVLVDAVLNPAQAAQIGEMTARIAGVRREAVSIADRLTTAALPAPLQGR